MKKWAHRIIMGSFALVAIVAGSTKPGMMNFPRTNPDVDYIRNNGSYVTNDLVHLNFIVIPGIPSTSSFYLDRCPTIYTNDQEKIEHTVNVYSNTFNRMTLPMDIPFENAISNNWYAYTDYVPPPPVHTNGVAVIIWQSPTPDWSTNSIVPVNTGIYSNGEKVWPNLDPLMPAGELTQENTDNE